FFFQAEDGIRDLIVTGVQTCALPICLRPAARGGRPGHALVAASGRCPGPAPEGRQSIASALTPRNFAPRGEGPAPEGRQSIARRSEERRVGKEWRSRWAREHVRRRRR